MSWISIVLFVIAHMSDLVAVIKDIIAALHGQGAQALNDFRSRVAAAIESGDLGSVRQVISDQAQCSGVACPSDLVKG